MHPSLLKLIGLRARAGRRQMMRGLKTPRGAVLCLIGCGMFVVWIGPGFFLGISHHARLVEPEAMRSNVPAILLLMCGWTILNAGGDKAIYFSPGEVNFLLGGPFRRRELLAYKLLFGVQGAALSSLIFAMAFLAYFPWWVSTYVGIFLSLGLIQLVSMSCMLIGQSIGERAYSRLRKLLIIMVVALIALPVVRMFRLSDGNIREAWTYVRESGAVQGLFAVFNVYGRAMTAERFYPDLIVWSGLALAINCILAGFVMWLDSDYIEASVIQSQKQYERLQRIRRGGLSGWGGRIKKRGRLAQLPWCGGAGPIAWRQLVSALRSSRGLLIMLVIIAVAVFPAMLVLRGGRGQIAVLGGIGWVSIFLTQRITFDFRGDLDHIDVLKSLPLRTTSVVLGELMVPVFVLTVLQLLIAVVATVLGLMPPYFLAFGAIVIVPVNFVLFEIDNLLFLLFPSRQMTGRPTDVQFFGRTMLMLFAKLILLGIAAVLVSAAGFLVYLAVGQLPMAIVGAGTFVLAIIAAVMVPCVAWAFRRFDISTETPP
jgi:hypothetical protein